MRLLHVVHDFLPRHRAGTEIYVDQLCRRLAGVHDVLVLCADYEPSTPHGTLRRREWKGIQIVEVVNNWAFATFEETYDGRCFRPAIDEVLADFRPDVIHAHSLLTLGLSVIEAAAERRVPVAMTLHDYGLVCPSGGKRVHLQESHVCRQIDVERCARCFPQSALHLQIVASTQLPAGVQARVVPFARAVARRVPVVLPLLRRAAGSLGTHPSAAAIDARRDRIRRAMAGVRLAVAPSAALADEFRELGFFNGAIEVSDNGYAAFQRAPRRRPSAPIRIGFVGTLSWEKGLHVLIDAVKRLETAKYELHVFGALETFPDYVAGLRRAATGLPVTFHGAFDGARIADVLAAIDVLVVPSVWMENSPLVIHEAFIAGVPVIASREGGMPALLGEGAWGLLYNSVDAGELAAILRGLLDEPDRLGQLSTRLPPVKPIEQDASDWESRYRRLIEGAAQTPSARTGEPS
jgi:glycosyltransferase involved in cell wall biosynthesis